MNNEVAIKVENVSKTFRIPHEKISSLRGAAISAFKKKSYEEFKALDNVSFEVKKGEFFGIIGRNGSGKSTLLKILAGIYQADKGKVKINGMISPFLELGIGFNPELSGRDNVYLNAIVLGLTKKEIDAKFDSIVKFSELERFIDQKLKNYSSGMQVRLAFSVSIHANRDILLMDEVLAVGDSNFSRKCINEFEKYKKNGKTVILVTHDIKTVEEYCDKAILLNNGKIVASGDPKKVALQYMEFNMTDEEKRLKQELKRNRLLKNDNESIDNDNTFGTHKARIVSCEVLNSEFKEAYTLESGNKFQIKLRIEFNEKVKKPVFAAMFRDTIGHNLFGIHSLYSRKPLVIDEVEKGKILDIVFESEMLLIPGGYSLYVACASVESHLNFEMLDVNENIANIQVYSKEIHWSPINADSIIKVIEVK